jgi:hypothetical protein
VSDQEKNEGTSSKDEETKEKKPWIDWGDPSVPAGNAPPLPRWPLALALVLWLAWMGFLLAMMVDRWNAS